MEVTYSDELDVPVTYFVGTCYYCITPGTPAQPLKRCSGCQLVAFCSRECQKKIWYKHKYVCKEFPLVNGKNVLETKGPWEKHLVELTEQADRLPHGNIAKLVFYNPRVCHTCRETRPDHLTDCQCGSVSYCGKKCAKADKPHKDMCRIIGQIGQSYNLSYMDDQTQRDRLLTYPTTLLYALKSLGKRRHGRDYRSIENLTTLNIHVVTSTPLFYHEPWDHFMHQLPNLKELNLVFIIQENGHKSSPKLNFTLSGLNLLQCKDCKAKDNSITYSVQQMLYHMYYSSPQYTEPDVVVVYGNSHDMSINVDDVHSKISYSNMLHDQDTVLVLTDATEDLVKQGARAVNAARPVEQDGPPKKNPLRGFGSKRADLDDKLYFMCLKRSL